MERNQNMKKATLLFLLFIAGIFSLQIFIVTAANAQQRIHGSIPKVISKLGLKPIGRLDSTERLNLSICLPVRNKQSLENLFDQINNPNSPQFHKYRTHQKITELFGPTEEEYLALENFAKKNGLKIANTYSNRMVLDVTGRVADIEKAFKLNTPCTQSAGVQIRTESPTLTP